MTLKNKRGQRLLRFLGKRDITAWSRVDNFIGNVFVQKRLKTRKNGNLLESSCTNEQYLVFFSKVHGKNLETSRTWSAIFNETTYCLKHICLFYIQSNLLGVYWIIVYTSSSKTKDVYAILTEDVIVDMKVLQVICNAPASLFGLLKELNRPLDLGFFLFTCNPVLTSRLKRA